MFTATLLGPGMFHATLMRLTSDADDGGEALPDCGPAKEPICPDRHKSRATPAPPIGLTGLIAGLYTLRFELSESPNAVGDGNTAAGVDAVSVIGRALLRDPLPFTSVPLPQSDPLDLPAPTLAVVLPPAAVRSEPGLPGLPAVVMVLLGRRCRPRLRRRTTSLVATATRYSGHFGALGRGIVDVMPGFLATLAMAGAAVTLCVDGGIILHGLQGYRVAGPLPSPMTWHAPLPTG